MGELSRPRRARGFFDGAFLGDHPVDERVWWMRYLADHDDFFYSADYLRAWFLEAMLGKHLAEKFGEKWFSSLQAGEFLKSIWSNGQKVLPEEIATMLGHPAISPDALVERLRSILK